MCYGCYEDANKPAIVNTKTKKAAKLIKNLYQQDGCAVGGYAHIVVEDWNLEHTHIVWCIEEAEKGEYDYVSEEGRQACITTLNFLKNLTKDEKYSAIALVNNFIT